MLKQGLSYVKSRIGEAEVGAYKHGLNHAKGVGAQAGAKLS